MSAPPIASSSVIGEKRAKRLIINRRSILLALCFLAGFISACSKEVPKTQTRLKGNRLYLIGESEPFSGYVAGKSRDGYRSDLCTYKKRYKEGLQHGKTHYWYPNGKLESVEPYENGKINGIVVRYYPTGRLKARMHLVNGERGGPIGEVYYSPDGKKLR